MKVISVSRRTDIPAFYTEWLINRITAGWCHWINPYAGQVYRVSLKPEDCIALVFWTRNPKPLLKRLPDLKQRGYSYYFHYSLTEYPEAIERHNPPYQTALDSFKHASDIVSPEFIQWRYDPIVMTSITPAEYHIENFAKIAGALKGYTQRCYLSFMQTYGKSLRNMNAAANAYHFTTMEPKLDEKLMLLEKLRDIAIANSITLYACCSSDIVGNGILKASCLDRDIIERLRPDLKLRLKKSPTRHDCGCIEGIDIGAYDLCLFGCSYCYATNSHNAALMRRREHDPNDSVIWRPESLKDIDLTTRETSSKKISSDNTLQMPLF